ncbi:MAG: hypothetical protein CXR30_15145 [Geobacter sp.]|nr:MAG: hypothetical protein CXR30_15145 [Geobacter sp.]
MALAQLSPSSVLANPAYINPHAQTEQKAAPVQANQTADIGVTKAKTDTVTISQQALQMSAKMNSSAKDQDGADYETYEKAGGSK